MVTIYDKDGNSKTLDSVDAREHIATGRWFTEKPEPVQFEVESVDGKASDHAVEANDMAEEQPKPEKRKPAK